MVATTDFDPEQSEEMVIASVQGPSKENTWAIKLAKPLQYMHWGTAVATGIPGREMLQV